MSAPGPIGVVGSSGEVGRVAVRSLRRLGADRLRLGARNAEAVRRATGGNDGGPCQVEVLPVDVFDAGALRRFCAGCAVVVNCSGPSCLIGDLVARAALAEGADYIDPAGDDELYRALAGLGFAAAGRAALISAGMMPGLTALLPRYLAAGGMERPQRLAAFVGGRDHFTVSAAADYLAAASSGYGQPAAAWHDGLRQAQAPGSSAARELPFFPGRVAIMPYLSTETERLARALGLAEVRWYSVFDGTHLLAALRRHQAARSGPALLGAAEEVTRAAQLDVFGTRPYQAMVMQLEGQAGQHPRTHALMVRANGASELTGAVAAVACWAVLCGEAAAGVHHAGEVLDPATAMARLRSTAAAHVVELPDVAVTVGPSAFQDGLL
ncbi:MAG: saccharopine dehydrogenase NADP-binding domain-containing protein [Streptosporangiaceae bacterium]